MIYALLLQNFDVRIYALFPQILETEKWTPQTFSLLECMPPPRNVTKLFTGLLQPTLQDGTGSFVPGGPYVPL